MSTLVTLAGLLPAFAILVVVALTVTLAQDLWAGWTPSPSPTVVDATDLPDAGLCRLQPAFTATFEAQMASARAAVRVTVWIARFMRAIQTPHQMIITWATAQVMAPSVMLVSPLARPVRAVPAGHLDGVARLRLAIH